MSAVITALLAALGQLASTAGASQIATIISALTNIIPFLIQEFEQAVPLVQNIITTLKGNNTVTQDQLDQLTALETQYDAAFEAAAAASGDDPGAAPAPATPTS